MGLMGLIVSLVPVLTPDASHAFAEPALFDEIPLERICRSKRKLVW
jgi:hypothetical protein